MLAFILASLHALPQHPSLTHPHPLPVFQGRTLEEMTAHFCEATGDESARLVLDQAAAECCAARRGRGGEGGGTGK